MSQGGGNADGLPEETGDEPCGCGQLGQPDEPNQRGAEASGRLQLGWNAALEQGFR
ncbi:hypothetical protein SALBM311S_09481 [Streptomyces alboniger]